MDFRKVKVRSIKLCYQEDIRRLPLETLKKMSGDSSTLDNLKALVIKTFPSLNGREFHLKYTDDESDTITVTTNGTPHTVILILFAQIVFWSSDNDPMCISPCKMNHRWTRGSVYGVRLSIRQCCALRYCGTHGTLHVPWEAVACRNANKYRRAPQCDMWWVRHAANSWRPLQV